MSLLRDMGLGMAAVLRALGFVRRHGMVWMFLVPVLLWLVLAFGIGVAIEGPVDRAVAWAGALLGVEPADAAPEGSTWSAVRAFLQGAWGVLVEMLLRLAALYLIWKINKYLVLILLSPLLAYASERSEEVLTGRRFPFSWAQLLRDAIQGSLVAFRNGIIEVSLSIVIWIGSLMMPVLAPVGLVLLFLISAYFYGFSMFDYLIERRRLPLRARIAAINDRKGLVLGNGLIFAVLMAIPLIGMMFAPVLCAVGASTVLLEHEQLHP